MTEEQRELVESMALGQRARLLGHECEALRALLQEREELRGAQVHLDAVSIALGLSRSSSRPVSEDVVELRQKYLALLDSTEQHVRGYFHAKCQRVVPENAPCPYCAEPTFEPPEAQREIERWRAESDVNAKNCTKNWLIAEKAEARIRELEAQLQAERKLNLDKEASRVITKYTDLERQLAAEREKRKRAHSLLIHVEDVERYSGWDAIKRARALLAESDKEGSDGT